MYVVRVAKKAVVPEFVRNEQADQYATRQACRKPYHVDQRKQFVSGYLRDEDFQVISGHQATSSINAFQNQKLTLEEHE
jgi:hypothetical protein